MLDKYLYSNSIIELTLSDEIPEENVDSGIPFVSDKRVTVLDFYRLTLHIKKSCTNGLFLKIKTLRVGYSRAYEIWSLISDIRESGRKVFVYLESPGNIEYFIATSADKIFIPPWSTLNLIGLSMENYYVRDLLENLSIEPEIEGFGEYKSAADTFNRTDMSEYHREMMNALLDNSFNNLNSAISKAREIAAASFKKIINNNPMNPEDGKANGLVDEICYEDEVKEILKNELSPEIRFINYSKYSMYSRYTGLIKELIRFIKGNKNYIGVVTISGIITQGKSKSGNGYISTCGSDSIIEILRKASEDNSIRGVLIRVISPGGSALASDLIRNDIKKLNDKKPVVISMSDVAASGGYMVSLSAGKIFANIFSITGSIGVVAGKFNINKLLSKIGVNHEIMKRGEMAEIYSPTKPFTAKEKKKFLSLIKDMYEQFVNLVAKERKIKNSEAEKAAKGRVWSSGDAKKMGLVDEIGTFDDAVKEILEKLEWEEGEELYFKELKTKNKISLSSIGKMGYGNIISDYSYILRSLEKEKLYTIMPVYHKLK